MVHANKNKLQTYVISKYSRIVLLTQGAIGLPTCMDNLVSLFDLLSALFYSFLGVGSNAPGQDFPTSRPPMIQSPS